MIHSDNGTNFKGTAKELHQAIRELNEAQPAAPHTGGAWERLIGSIKIALHTRSMTGRAVVELSCLLHFCAAASRTVFSSLFLVFVLFCASMDHPPLFLLG